MDSTTKALKWMVISLGIFLLGGMMLLVSAVFDKASKKPEQCEEAALTLPEGYRILTADRDRHTLTLLLAHPEQGQEIWEVERCSGERVYRLQIR